MEIDNLENWKKQNVPKARIEHMQRTADLAASLSKIHHLNEEKAYFAALAHDIAKDKKNTELLKIAETNNLIAYKEEAQAPFLLHGQVGAYILNKQLDCQDNDILFTVHWHTTGHYNFENWSWATFLADKLEPKKIEYEKDLEHILEIAKKSILRAVIEFINWRIDNRKQANAIIHPMSYHVLERLTEKII
tara:strand:- start:362 stop:934 length:573 start_codon:yes stop_codon:yes gene_type:complete